MQAPSSVIVALSGGVDSAVAALMLRDAGHDVQCLHMTNWEDDGYCEAAADYRDASAVCRVLGLSLHRVSFAREYREQVFARFLDEHRAGRTPNPDVLCNRQIKFGAMRAYARRLGADWLATGHYARVDSTSGRVRLLEARDRGKDQTYFLHAVHERDLEAVLFPLGNLLKQDVRAMALAAGLPVARKKDSTGICFIGERPFTEFLQRYLPQSPGPILTPAGERLGTHDGLAFYTLGQRHGLGLGGRKACAQAPWYVAAKDFERNALVVVQGHDHALLMHESLRASGMHWIGDPPPRWSSGDWIPCAAKTRYRQRAAPCAVRSAGGQQIDVAFDEPQRAVTPGQSVVLYDGERCLGGGTIEHAGRNDDAAPAPGSQAQAARAG